MSSVQQAIEDLNNLIENIRGESDDDVYDALQDVEKLIDIAKTLADAYQQSIETVADKVARAVAYERQRCRAETLREVGNRIDDLEYPRNCVPSSDVDRYDEQCRQIQDELRRMAKEAKR